MGQLEALAQLDVLVPRPGRDIHHGRVRAARPHQHQGADHRDRVVAENLQPAPGAQDAVQVLQHARRVPVDRMFQQLEDPFVLRRRQDLVQHFRIQLLWRNRQKLVEDAERVAHRAVGQPGHALHDDVRRLGALLLGDLVQPPGDVVRADVAEIEPLAAALDGQEDLLDLGGRQNELDVIGGLLERLQQRVERPGREHVHFVDDVDFEPRPRRAVRRVAP